MGANNSRPSTANQNNANQQQQQYDYQNGRQQYQQQQQQQQQSNNQQQMTAQQRQQLQAQQHRQQQAAMQQQNAAQAQQQMQRMQAMQMQQQTQMMGANAPNSNTQQYNQMYRTWRQTMHSKSGNAQAPAPNDDLKNFYIKVALNKESIKAKISEGHKLMITFKYDTLCDAHIRINMCVTEKKNPNNAPEMFYTPNRENYIQNLSVHSGVDQEIQQGQIQFDTNYLAAFELSKSIKDYHPMIISVNYQDAGAQYAMMTYCTFTKDGDQNINGVHVTKQVALINGLPFELKSIYGMTADDGDAEEGHQAIEDDNPDAECLICLSDPKDTLIMPCCHFCVCENCGKELVKAKQTCPICRGNISSLIPMKKNH